ncbi:hypothetical protein HK12_10870 [Acetobacter orientalis]|uniref:Uncharacterized protein n=1 Tax=Acetobacter orientalis TaxID=146474 RepID=A0A251ZZD7_9PROT|nr:hypothetical protein HK12_10870 [Acetobacter orientalis]
MCGAGLGLSLTLCFSYAPLCQHRCHTATHAGTNRLAIFNGLTNTNAQKPPQLLVDDLPL